MLGIYEMDAISATVGNMFKGKGKKAIEYPDKPHDFSGKKEIDEEEIIRKRNLLMTSLLIMKDNFDLEKKSEGNK